MTRPRRGLRLWQPLRGGPSAVRRGRSAGCLHGPGVSRGLPHRGLVRVHGWSRPCARDHMAGHGACSHDHMAIEPSPCGVEAARRPVFRVSPEWPPAKLSESVRVGRCHGLPPAASCSSAALRSVPSSCLWGPCACAAGRGRRRSLCRSRRRDEVAGPCEAHRRIGWLFHPHPPTPLRGSCGLSSRLRQCAQCVIKDRGAVELITQLAFPAHCSA